MRDAESYALKKGLLLGYHDNPSDVEQIQRGRAPSYCYDGPRQVANILYKGKVMTCWKHNVQPLESRG